jgi:transmembrane sensor
MDISKFTIEDFVFDTDFRNWVLHPDVESNIFWESQIANNPSQQKNIQLAMDYIIRMSIEGHELENGENEEIWSKIKHEINRDDLSEDDKKIIPIYPHLSKTDSFKQESGFTGLSQFYKLAIILLLTFGLAYLLPSVLVKNPQPQLIVEKIDYEEHITPKGAKLNLTLSDGSKVYLNSRSVLRYVKGFEKDKRELFLDGEAFFEVSKDSLRPFSVVHNKVGVTALGTSFNVQAYPNENITISLFSGRVGVGSLNGIQKQLELEKGEGLSIKPEEGIWIKSKFDEEEVLAWTRKTIVFNDTPVAEAIRVLENWYGVEFKFQNKPRNGLLISGKFKNETLQNVLEGLAYTTKLDFSIEKEIITIKFKK